MPDGDGGRNAGILGTMRAHEGSHIAAVWGRDSALGHDAENVMSSLVGTSSRSGTLIAMATAADVAPSAATDAKVTKKRRR